MNSDPNTLSSLALLLLALLLIAAAISDWRTHRIPNIVVAIGLVCGLLLNAFLPEGRGFASPLPGALGFSTSLAAAAMGLLALLPLYAMRAMGAGDVKLMAMVGAFLGPNGLLAALIVSFACAGVLALFCLLRSGALARFADSLQLVLASRLTKVMVREASTVTLTRTGLRIPFGVAIATGTLFYVYMASRGELLFLHLLSI